MDSISRTCKADPWCSTGQGRFHEPQETIPHILPGQAIYATLADGTIERPAPVTVNPHRALSQTAIGGGFVGLVAPNQSPDSAIVDQFFVALWITQPGEHLGG